MERLTREEVVKVIEGKGAAKRIPLAFDFWVNPNAFGDSVEKRNEWFAQKPCDIDYAEWQMPGMTEGFPEDPDFFWAAPGIENTGGDAIDNQCLIEDWEEDGEEFFKYFPNPDSPAMFVEKKEKDGRYLLGRWWFCYFERLWSLRGMENALTDFYLYPEYVHELFQKLTDFYMRMMERAKEEWDVDGFFVSDDIGTQTSPFFSLDIFREFFKPYYKQIFDKAHELGTHFWLHTCGNIEMFIPEFIEIGLDVLHPIQRNTMDEKKISEEYSPNICVWAGLDVQYLMAFGTPEEVKEEVRYLKKNYAKPEGRMILTFGNASTPDWKLENMEALYEAAVEE